jgi:TRAP transporter TAXI family solute receptor
MTWKWWFSVLSGLMVLWVMQAQPTSQTVPTSSPVVAQAQPPMVAQREGSSAKPLPREITVTSLRPGTTFYAVASGVAKLVTERTQMRATVLPVAGTADVLTAVQRGDAELGICSSQTCWQTFKGVEGFPRIADIRLVQIGIPLRVGWVVRKDSGLKTFADVRGKQVNRHRVSSFAVYDRAFLANAGLSWNDVKPVDVTDIAAGIGAFREGRSDVGEHSLGSAQIAEANVMMSGGVRWLSADPSPEAVDRARRATFPGFYAQLLKAGSFVGVVDDTQFLAVDVYLATHKKVSDDVVRTVVQALLANYRELAPLHPALREWVPERFLSPSATVPFHPAAVAVYKEKGLWKAEQDSAQQRLLKEAGE